MLSFYLSMLETEEQRDQFEQLYSTYRKKMLYAANRILNDYQLSEDAVHLAFMKIINYLDGLEDIECHKTRSFVVIVVEGVSKRLYNKRKKGESQSLDDMDIDVPAEQDTLDEVIGNYEENRIVSKIRELSTPYSKILMLRYLDQFTDKEISDLLGINQAAVRKRLQRARKELKLLLEEG